MRISLTDFFQITTIVAAYLAGLAWIFGEVPFVFPQTPIALLLLLEFPLLQAALTWGGRRKCGRELTSFWKPAKWLSVWWLLPLILLAVYLIGYDVKYGQRTVVLLYHGIFLAIIGTTIVEKRVVLGEQGVNIDRQCFLWSEHQIALAQDRDKSYVSVPRKYLKNFWPPHRALVPPGNLDQVRAILSAKQAERTTDHTDGHG
jgi:hypothetical protein